MTEPMYTVEVCAPLPRSLWNELGRCWSTWVQVDGFIDSARMLIADGVCLPCMPSPLDSLTRAMAVTLADAYEGCGYRARIREV